MDWRRTAAALGGRSAVLNDINLFLPPTPSQRRDLNMYTIYCERAMWYGGAARTLDAWIGTLTRKPMAVEVPSRYKWRLDNIDRQGTDINSFARAKLYARSAHTAGSAFWLMLVTVITSTILAQPPTCAGIRRRRSSLGVPVRLTVSRFSIRSFSKSCLRCRMKAALAFSRGRRFGFWS